MLVTQFQWSLMKWVGYPIEWGTLRLRLRVTRRRRCSYSLNVNGPLHLYLQFYFIFMLNCMNLLLNLNLFLKAQKRKFENNCSKVGILCDYHFLVVVLLRYPRNLNCTNLFIFVASYSIWLVTLQDIFRTWAYIR